MNLEASPPSAAVELDSLSANSTFAFAWRHVAILSVVTFLAMLPVTMLVPVLKEIVAVRFGASTFWVHCFMSVNMVGALLAAPLAGVVADRLGRRKPILLLAAIANGILLWGMAVVESLPALFVARFFEGMAQIIVVTSLMAIASDWAQQSWRGRAMGMVGAGMIFGTTIGSPLGGLIGRQSAHLVLPLGALICLGIAILIVPLVREGSCRKSGVSLARTAVLLRSSRGLPVAYAYAFIDRFCVGVIVSTFMLYISDVLGMAPAQRGLLIACFMFPFSILTYPIGRLSDRYGRIWPLVIGSFSFGLVFAAYGWVPPSGLPVVLLGSGVLAAIMFAPNLAMCADLAPPRQRALAFAGFNMAGSLGFLAGPLFGGTLSAWLAPSLGQADAYRFVLTATGALEVLCAVLTLPALLKLRRSAKLR